MSSWEVCTIWELACRHTTPTIYSFICKLWGLYVCTFQRHGDDGIHYGLITAMLTVSCWSQNVTEILCFSDAVYVPCAAMLKPVVRHITTLVSVSHLHHHLAYSMNLLIEFFVRCWWTELMNCLWRESSEIDLLVYSCSLCSILSNYS